ncbi:MAG: hypothetical protein L3J43_03555 [Sulfurovum sp.]|nr:hypothetical protein [Sulfurovum sp.]
MKITINTSIKTAGFILLSALLLSACGEDKKSSAPKAYKGKMKQCPNFVNIGKGSEIVAGKNDTKIKIIHTENGKKQACKESGEADVK